MSNEAAARTTGTSTSEGEQQGQTAEQAQASLVLEAMMKGHLSEREWIVGALDKFISPEALNYLASAFLKSKQPLSTDQLAAVKTLVAGMIGKVAEGNVYPEGHPDVFLTQVSHAGGPQSWLGVTRDEVARAAEIEEQIRADERAKIAAAAAPTGT